MKLLCINANKIDEFDDINRIHFINRGDNLIEGQVYETNGKPYIGASGHKCYYIKGLGSRLACRFTELLTDSIIAKNKLEEINQN